MVGNFMSSEDEILVYYTIQQNGNLTPGNIYIINDRTELMTR